MLRLFCECRSVPKPRFAREGRRFPRNDHFTPGGSLARTNGLAWQRSLSANFEWSCWCILPIILDEALAFLRAIFPSCWSRKVHVFLWAEQRKEGFGFIMDWLHRLSTTWRHWCFREMLRRLYKNVAIRVSWLLRAIMRKVCSFRGCGPLFSWDLPDFLTCGTNLPLCMLNFIIESSPQTRCRSISRRQSRRVFDEDWWNHS